MTDEAWMERVNEWVQYHAIDKCLESSNQGFFANMSDLPFHQSGHCLLIAEMKEWASRLCKGRAVFFKDGVQIFEIEEDLMLFKISFPND